MVRWMDLIEKFLDLSLISKVTPQSVMLGMLKLTNTILDEIKEGQKSDLGLIDQLVLTNQGK